MPRSETMVVASGAHSKAGTERPNMASVDATPIRSERAPHSRRPVRLEVESKTGKLAAMATVEGPSPHLENSPFCTVPRESWMSGSGKAQG